jgi:probable phosphoglycerate mutase
LQRCVLTGARIAAPCGIKGEVREGLGDIDYGGWQMRSHDEVSAESPEAYPAVALGAAAHALSQG